MAILGIDVQIRANLKALAELAKIQLSEEEEVTLRHVNGRRH